MKILCAVDGSEFSQWAIEAVGALGRNALSSVTLLHVADTRHLKSVGAPHVATYRGAKAALEKSGEDILRRAASHTEVALSQSAVRPRTAVRTLLLRGSPASTIARCAAQERSDLIVLGTRGLSDIKGFLLGSIARQVASLAACSVLVVKRPIKTARQILLSVDESKYSQRAAKFLRSGILPETENIIIFSSAITPITELAARHLTEQQINALNKPILERATDFVAKMRDDFIKEGFTVTTEVQFNHVVDAIIRIATYNHADLLVVGSRGLSVREGLRLGSVSESLLRHAPCSILIVRDARA
ncbi:MAG: universal stress protein [Nitrospira sp.]|nr:universal stress protein [Nitrospira sp.]MBH0180686.1 universal stress protein [Nitrospira sp.]MBH0187253.1 universal stress protein [Nitrospira sp.]MBH0197760.1 universal stress protein [Nitrospira sp.]